MTGGQLQLSRRRFSSLVDEAIASLPPDFGRAMQNVAIQLRPWPTRRELEEAGVPPGETLLGLYVGIPLTERTGGYNMVAPDVIILYQGPIEAASDGSLASIRNETRRTLLHELAHHFGIDDDRLHELGAY